MAEKIDSRQEITVRDFLNVFFRRKYLILAIVALATVLVFYLKARQPDLYESTSRILVQRGERSNVMTGTVRYLGWEEEVSSQIEVILSETVFQRARKIFADSVAARNRPADWRFSPGAVRADVVGESNVFAIRYTDFDRGVCKLGCQAMTFAFQEYYREKQAPPALGDFFASQIADVRSDLEAWQIKRNDFLNREKFFGLSDESRFLLQNVGVFEIQLLDVNGKISEQTSRVEGLAALLKLSGKAIEDALAMRSSDQVFQATIVQRIKFELQELNMRREDLAHKYTDMHPEVVAADAQIAELHINLKREVENVYHIELQGLEVLYQRKAAISDQLNRARAQLETLPDKDLELRRFDTVIENLRAKYEMLLEKQSESEITIASQPEWDVSILSNASEPYSKKTRDYVRLALGPFLALIVALGVAFFLESLDHSVKSVAEAEEHLGKPVLATFSERQK